jgi:hypothetical protein
MCYSNYEKISIDEERVKLLPWSEIWTWKVRIEYVLVEPQDEREIDEVNETFPSGSNMRRYHLS